MSPISGHIQTKTSKLYPLNLIYKLADRASKVEIVFGRQPSSPYVFSPIINKNR